MFSGRNGNSLAAEVTFTAAYEKIKMSYCCDGLIMCFTIEKTLSLQPPLINRLWNGMDSTKGMFRTRLKLEISPSDSCLKGLNQNFRRACPWQ